MATVYALIEYLPIGANGVTGEAVLSEHATPEAALAAKQALYEQRPELVGCLVIRSVKQKAELEVLIKGKNEVTAVLKRVSEEVQGVSDAQGRDVGGGAAGVTGADGAAGGVLRTVGQRDAGSPSPNPRRYGGGGAGGAGPLGPSTSSAG